MKEYSSLQTLAANTPYMIMVVAGAVLIAFGLSFSVWGWIEGAAFIVYGIAGAVWIFVCPFCAFYGTSGCPCGYGKIGARLQKKGERNCFSEKFKKHIPVIVPLWIIPAIPGGG